MTWCFYVIKRSCDFVDNIFSSGATCLSSLVTIDFVEVETTFFICHLITWPCDQRVTWLCLKLSFSLTHQPSKYGSHNSCGNRDMIQEGRKDRQISLSYYKVRQFNFVAFFDILQSAKCKKVVLLQSVTGCYYKVRQVHVFFYKKIIFLPEHQFS